MEQEKQPTAAEREWVAAELALAEARRMPGGAERYEALKRAGRLRLRAERLRAAARAGAHVRAPLAGR